MQKINTTSSSQVALIKVFQQPIFHYILLVHSNRCELSLWLYHKTRQWQYRQANWASPPYIRGSRSTVSFRLFFSNHIRFCCLAKYLVWLNLYRRRIKLKTLHTYLYLCQRGIQTRSSCLLLLYPLETYLQISEYCRMIYMYVYVHVREQTYIKLLVVVSGNCASTHIRNNMHDLICVIRYRDAESFKWK